MLSKRQAGNLEKIRLMFKIFYIRRVGKKMNKHQVREVADMG